jgi:hypothetical protein
MLCDCNQGRLPCTRKPLPVLQWYCVTEPWGTSLYVFQGIHLWVQQDITGCSPVWLEELIEELNIKLNDERRMLEAVWNLRSS